MKQIRSCDGQEFRDMFVAGSSWLEKSVPDINAINVFPVPDGDTGTNMFLTMRAVMEEADRITSSSVSAVAKAMAQGALMGARGNSGVILSQFFRGLAKGFDEKETITGSDFAVALDEASRAAYRGLSQPVEGTMLTVLKDVSKAAEEAARTNPDNLTRVTEAAVDAAKDSVARTPLLLDVLREAGVVDAGGQGVYVILEGALRYLEGNVEEMKYRRPQMVAAELPSGAKAAPLVAEAEAPYGYCTNFLLEGHKLRPDKIRKKLESKGQSIVVVGDENTVRVHIHTYDPGGVIRYATSLGTLHQLQVQNMDDQHVGFIEMQKEKLLNLDIGVIAVAAGSGMRDVFRSLGAAAIVPGGQTMNPSVQEILKAVESVPSQKVILLPNNKNIILAASQVHSLTPKEIAVIPTKTVPQGIAALIAFNYEGGMEENIQAMEEAIATVKTVEITEAARSTQLQGLKIKKGQVIAIIDDEHLVTAGDNLAEVLFEALDKTDIGSAEVVTVYYGADIEAAQAEQIVNRIHDKYPEKQVEMVSGGQQHYRYIVSLE
ncbi:MAG: dihydroxyacetone kinase [Chloroflexi bacterium RBG_13_50_10]|nr:MAG: dihydroxyacetone kinase [Chloroflexi bacterium RBG_13_50_10]